MTHPTRPTRRGFLAATAAAGAAVVLGGCEAFEERDGSGPEKIIDVHQHTSYHGRSDEDLVAHQRALGVTRTVLLPAGSKYGLEAGCGGNETALAVARRFPAEFVFFANEIPDLEGARAEIEKYLGLGAIGIGEQKFEVDGDSPAIELVASIARERGVPILLHFQHGKYNREFARFHRILEKFPAVNFIGHAQTWWGNIDKAHVQDVLYPKGKVTPGGLTDRYLADYPNIFGDLSAGSGLNALLRDEEHARGFLARHQEKLLFGTDCEDPFGAGEKCQGAQTLAAVRRLVPDARARHKILYANAQRLLKV
jgi:predicted TIM-barrel fold metal-dependent hydrolase